MAERAKVIDEGRIRRNLEVGRGKSREEVLACLKKAEEAKGLEPEEAAALLQVEDPDLRGEIFQAARRVKIKIYGKRLVLFAPLYLSNYCVNNCRYCGFRRDNRFVEAAFFVFLPTPAGTGFISSDFHVSSTRCGGGDYILPLLKLCLHDDGTDNQDVIQNRMNRLRRIVVTG